MQPLSILILSDGRPGHYHLAEGVAAAAARLREVRIERRDIQRRRAAPTRALSLALMRGLIGPARLLGLGYGLDARTLPPAGLVISAGGDTIAANVAAARALAAANIFCGTLRHMGPENFSLIVSSYERHAGLPRHVVTLKPTAMDPDALHRPPRVPRLGPDNRPASTALLIGGDSGLFRYTQEEWRGLIAFLPKLSAAWGTRWLVSTSRRTPGVVADEVARLAHTDAVIAAFTDFRTAGPGTLPGLLSRADAVLCTEDSSTMISEAIAARLPVVGVAPAVQSFKPEEADYRQLMLARGWARFLPLSALMVESFGQALSEVTPMAENHIATLARMLQERLPELFEAQG